MYYPEIELKKEGNILSAKTKLRKQASDGSWWIANFYKETELPEDGYKKTFAFVNMFLMEVYRYGLFGIIDKTEEFTDMFGNKVWERDVCQETEHERYVEDELLFPKGEEYKRISNDKYCDGLTDEIIEKMNKKIMS